MTLTRLLLLGAAALTLCLACARSPDPTTPMQERIVRLAELEIDPSQVEAYKSALREEIEESIRVEPGVLMLYAVSPKDSPTQVRLFEMYADMAAYRAHLETPHFKKYKTGTQGMVKSLKLIEADPILLGAKPSAQ